MSLLNFLSTFISSPNSGFSSFALVPNCNYLCIMHEGCIQIRGIREYPVISDSFCDNHREKTDSSKNRGIYMELLTSKNSFVAVSHLFPIFHSNGVVLFVLTPTELNGKYRAMALLTANSI